MSQMDEALDRLKEEIEQGVIHDRETLARRKREAAAALHLERMPSNSEILAHMDRPYDFLRRKPVRTLSGVAVIAVMSRPAPCPHGTCVYCPGGPTADVPQSYTGHEPASMRAIQNRYHPFLQVYKRIEQLHSIGHPTDKVELIIMGGTFPSQDLDYQEYFVRECLSAMNRFDPSVPASAVEEALFGDTGVPPSDATRAQTLLSRRPLLLEDAQKRNERARNRCVGMTFETRPDWSKRPHIDRMLLYGGTRVELGVQTVYDFIYARVKRGHTTRDSIEATALLKDQGVKVNYHVMPGLPGSDKERDLRMVERIVSDPDYRPDMMKFYTCLVMENTPLHDDYVSGNYVPYSTDETVDLLVRAKSLLPPWIRTMRIQRDIPTTRIAAGVMSSNMGQMVEDEMRRRGISCQCIRCREIGLQSYKRGIEHRREDVNLVTRTYDASGGTEVFLSYEDERHDALIGFLRLRIPGDHVFRREITEKSALVRELHVYGPLAALGTNERDLPWWQHQGYGKKLLGEAERIAHERYGAAKMVVISGIGVREYYRSQGYRKEGPYVTKRLP